MDNLNIFNVRFIYFDIFLGYFLNIKNCEFS